MANATKLLREKTGDDLRAELLSLRREGFNLRMQFAVQQNAKSSEMRRVRRQIARVLTILGEKKEAR